MKQGSIPAFVLVLIAGIVIAGAGVFVYSNKLSNNGILACTEEAKLCSDGSSVGRSGPRCEFSACPKEDVIVVESPRAYDEITSPLVITGKARTWYFEASFPVELLDANGKVIAAGPARAEGNWMTNEFVPFKIELKFNVPSTKNGTLIFKADNPSGLPEHDDKLRMPIRFKDSEESEQRKISLFYYNPDKDKDETGNIMCTSNGLVAIERYIPLSISPVKDTLDLFLKGKQNLTQKEVAAGITTEYPLAGLSVKSINLKPDGALIIELDDPQNSSVGGSCRVSVLLSQLSATLRQFAEVKSLHFIPEDALFQP